MQTEDAEIRKARETILPLFIDKYGRTKKTPYYVTQLQTLFENNHFPWIIYQAADQLIKQKILDLRSKLRQNIMKESFFFYNAQLEAPKHRSALETRIKSNCKLIDKYSAPTVGRALGNHLEGLVKAELRAQGFRIIGTHTMKYKDKEWSRTRNNLEFVPEHISKKLAVGVEVKNTLPIIEREELDIKLEMCEYLGMVSTLPHLRL